VKLNTHLCLILNLRMIELYVHSPMYLHGVMLNYVINCRDNVKAFVSNEIFINYGDFHSCRMLTIRSILKGSDDGV
jgi:hypothetical protein